MTIHPTQLEEHFTCKNRPSLLTGTNVQGLNITVEKYMF